LRKLVIIPKIPLGSVAEAESLRELDLIRILASALKKTATQNMTII
jgi:hypothetical protein